jgi:hypothetical protein
MTLSHLVITRFSYRGKDVFRHVSGPTFYGDDPLNPERLDMRFKLFELACLPSVREQTEQRFMWVILVDRALPESCLAKLRSLVAVRQPTFIHAFDPKSDPGALDWLRPYLPEGVDRVATTNLDDDDSLPRSFVAVLQRRLVDLEGGGRLPPIGIVGARRIVEWDLMPSTEAPLGWKAPWHRKTSVASAGLSLYCRVPAFNLCVLALRHGYAEKYLRFSRSPGHPSVTGFQQSVRESAGKCGYDLEAWPPEAFFHDISAEIGPVLMTNHASNDQARRVLEPKPERTAVTGPADFPDLPIDWGKAGSLFRDPAAPGEPRRTPSARR